MQVVFTIGSSDGEDHALLEKVLTEANDDLAWLDLTEANDDLGRHR